MTTTLQVPDYLCGENQYQTKENILLLQAASDGDIDKLREALESGANPNYIEKNGEQLGTLHIAATSPKSMSLECVSSLIDSGANPKVRSIADRCEPIHLAANIGNKDIVAKLVEASPKSISSENAFGNTCLHLSTRAGSSDIVELLLSKGADVNQKNHRGSTSLHIACFLASPSSSNDDDDQYLKTATVLLNNDKIDIDAKDISGYTPLHIAAQRGCDDMVKLLIDNGASLTAKTNIDSKGRGNRTAAGMAKFGNHASTLKIIEDAMNKGELHLSVSKNEFLKVSKE